MYYSYSIELIRNKIKIFLHKRKKIASKQKETIDHILWMLNEIENMKNDRPAKAGRWIGWVLANLEFMEIITNQESQDMIRTDVANNND